jgi:hypothetical protein
MNRSIDPATAVIGTGYLMPSFGRYEVAAEVLDVLEREAVGA